MKTDVNWDTREFERALRQVAGESDRADHEIVTMNSRTLLKSTVYNTPRDTGTARAGYWPAWQALEMSGSPGTRRAYRTWTKKKSKREMVPEGKVDDRRKEKDPSFEFVNKTHHREGGTRTYYPFILNARTNFFGKAEQEAAFKFGRAYEKLLRKHGKL